MWRADVRLIWRRAHRFDGALQHGGVHAVEPDVPEGPKKRRRLRVTGGVERRIDAGALHDAAQVEVGLAVADEVEIFDWDCEEILGD